jgi:PIN domain nuclease of toxin-antitoxin system
MIAQIERDRLATLLESDIDILLSIASLWEIAIKTNLGKLELPNTYQEFISEQISLNSIEILPITIMHLDVVSKLPLHHRDPFDRLIISQAISEDIPIVSVDRNIHLYKIELLS